MMKIDAIVLGWCTKISHALQSWIGWTNYGSARIGVVMAMFAQICHVFYGTPARRTAELIWTVIFVTCGLIRIKVLHRAEARLYAGEALENVGAPHICLRIFWLLWVPFVSLLTLLDGLTAIHGLNLIFNLGMEIESYFSSVIPMPPGKTKARQFMDSLQRHGTLIPQETRT